MDEKAQLIIDGKTYELPIFTGSEGEKAIDISRLRQNNGYITLDAGFGNTGSCKSNITFMDGEKGVLRYRGIPVEQLAEQATFKEVAYLLINGDLPTHRQLNRFSVLLNDHSLVHEDMRTFYQSFPRASHPMGILSGMVNALRSFYPELQNHFFHGFANDVLQPAAARGMWHAAHGKAANGGNPDNFGSFGINGCLR